MNGVKAWKIVRYMAKRGRNMKAMKNECGICGKCEKYGECMGKVWKYEIMEIYETLVKKRYEEISEKRR
jgi:hypothetical protein